MNRAKKSRTKDKLGKKQAHVSNQDKTSHLKSEFWAARPVVMHVMSSFFIEVFVHLIVNTLFKLH